MLVPKKRAALAALLSTSTIAAAARKVGVSRQTLDRWLDEPEFRQELDAALDRTLRYTSLQLRQRTMGAIERLTKEMGSRKPSNGRIMAAKEILLFDLKYGEAVDVRERIERLQAQVDAMTCPQPSPTSDASNDS